MPTKKISQGLNLTGSSVSFNVRAVTASETLRTTDHVVLVNATGGAVTLTLPPVASLGPGFEYVVVKTDSSANAVTLDGNGTETIDGATTRAIRTQWGAYRLVVDPLAAQWYGVLGTTSSGIVDAGTNNLLLRSNDSVVAEIDYDASGTTSVFAVRSNASGTNVFSVGETGLMTISGTFTGDTIALTNADAGTIGTRITTTHNSASPAANDQPFILSVVGKDDGGNDTEYGRFRCLIVDPVNGSEDSSWVFTNMVAGALSSLMTLNGTANTINQGGLTISAGNVVVTSGNLTLTSGNAALSNGTLTVTSTSASALTAGRQGATNPALKIDASAASSVTGVQVTAAAAAAGVDVSAISSGANENLTINAKGTGTITFGNTSTGNFTLSRATTVTAGGLNLSNAIGSLAGGTADIVTLGAYDLSAGNATLSLGTETAVTAAAAGASDAYLNVRINGTTYKLLLHT